MCCCLCDVCVLLHASSLSAAAFEVSMCCRLNNAYLLLPVYVWMLLPVYVWMLLPVWSPSSSARVWLWCQCAVAQVIFAFCCLYNVPAAMLVYRGKMLGSLYTSRPLSCSTSLPAWNHANMSAWQGINEWWAGGGAAAYYCLFACCLSGFSTYKYIPPPPFYTQGLGNMYLL